MAKIKPRYSPELTQFRTWAKNYIKNYYNKRGGKDPDVICSHLAGVVTAMKINNQAHSLPMDDSHTAESMVFIERLWHEVCLDNDIDPRNPCDVIKEF